MDFRYVSVRVGALDLMLVGVGFMLQVAGEKRSGGRNYGVASNLPADSEEIGFDFRKQHFIYSKELKKFCKLDYPTKDTFRTYMKNTGYGSEAKALAATEKWGKNMYVCSFLICLLLVVCIVCFLKGLELCLHP